jgi:hypothetical protein
LTLGPKVRSLLDCLRMRSPKHLLSCALLLACARAEAPPAAPTASSDAAPHASDAPTRRAANESAAPRPADLVFHGMCDASGAVPLDDHLFVVADDEDNLLRAYDARAPGAPLWMVDVSPAIGVEPKPSKPGKPPKPAPEIDLEAATRIGELAFWLTSHGRNSSGKAKPERLRLFATSVPRAGAPLKVVGSAYDRLVSDMIADPRFAGFGLEQAAELAPKAPGGLNLEGMTRRREGGVWIGFRNPIPGGKALLVPLLNPEDTMHGKPASLGDPRLLNLGGRGVRGLSLHGERYLVVGGAYDGSQASQLYVWDGADGLRTSGADVSGLNPEGFFSPSGSTRVLVLSDDGGQLVGGVECKRLKDASAKRFRARFIEP